MDQKTIDTIKAFLRAIAEMKLVLISAFVFGSFARGNQKADSDIDLALVVENMNDNEKFDLQVKLILLASKFDARIEPHPFSKNDFMTLNPFVEEVKRTGIEISWWS